MASIPSTQDEWTIHALNIHGVFFERRCAILVNETPGWGVLTTNYPVEFPPPSGPLRGKESSLDIWARRNDPTFVMDALIECKKANPDFVNWVFFPKLECSTTSVVLLARCDNKLNENGSGRWSTQTSLPPVTTQLSIANEAREVRGDYNRYQGGNKTKTSNAAIQEAAYQIALATRAIVNEEGVLLTQLQASPAQPAPPWLSKAYFPLIITTANLFSADYQPQATKLESGEIDLHNVILNPVHAIVYEYALPRHLQYSLSEPLQVLKSGKSDVLSRMHIFVVHAATASNFLRSVGANPSQS
jgi:hypothetical protein